jgi:hypothetical protein
VKRRAFLALSATAAALLPAAAFGRKFLSVDDARQLMFPGQALDRVSVTLDAAQSQAIERASGVPVHMRELAAWRAADGGWYLVDEVVGKHENITWALAIDGAGAVRQLEILEYRESYGGEVSNARWRKQFVGRTPQSLPVFDTDVRNISGATLSCSHLTEGVRRLLATYDVVLRHLPPG